MKFKILLVFIWVVGSLSYCTFNGYLDYVEVLDADAIYWHESDRFTIVKADKITKELSYYSTRKYSLHIRAKVFITDKKGFACWYYRDGFGTINPRKSKCEVYITSLDEVGTGNWNHGKFGSGTTERVN